MQSSGKTTNCSLPASKSLIEWINIRYRQARLEIVEKHHRNRCIHAQRWCWMQPEPGGVNLLHTVIRHKCSSGMSKGESVSKQPLPGSVRAAGQRLATWLHWIILICASVTRKYSTMASVRQCREVWERPPLRLSNVFPCEKRKKMNAMAWIGVIMSDSCLFEAVISRLQKTISKLYLHLIYLHCTTSYREQRVNL